MEINVDDLGASYCRCACMHDNEVFFSCFCQKFNDYNIVMACTFFPGGPLLPGTPGSPGSPGVPGRPYVVQ